MQKSVRISLQKSAQSLRRTRAKALRDQKIEQKKYDRWRILAQQEENRHIKNERRTRRDDWIRGPLAGARDALVHGENGHAKEFGPGRFGTTTGQGGLASRPPLPATGARGGGPRRGMSADLGGDKDGIDTEPDPVREGEFEFRGEGMVGNLVVGDKACVVRGREGVRGQIRRVTDVKWEEGTVTLEGINVMDVEVPRTAHKSQQTREVRSTEMPLDINDVRLVVKLEGRDVIVRHMHAGPPYTEQDYGSNLPQHTRYVSGMDVAIPWPEAEVMETKRQVMDTPRREVEAVSYEPEIIADLMPPGVEKELMADAGRDGLSRMRKETWTDAEWIRKKIMEDARSTWYERRAKGLATARLGETKNTDTVTAQ